MASQLVLSLLSPDTKSLESQALHWPLRAFLLGRSLSFLLSRTRTTTPISEWEGHYNGL